MGAERIGIIGGGQLGRMLTEAAKPMGFDVTVLDPTEPQAPAAMAGAEQIFAELNDYDGLYDLVADSDVTTWEIEHIDARKLIEIEEATGIRIEPSPQSLEIINDKLRQKNFLLANDIPHADFREVTNQAELASAMADFGSVIVKERFGGFDGRGNLELSEPDWQKVESSFKVDAGIYVEQRVSLGTELSVIVARDKQAHVEVYPTIETVQLDGQCNMAVAPARIETAMSELAQQLALETVSHFNGAGVFAIEMFLTADNKLLVNEIAPRVHNSGHLTMEANATSQFEQHIRAITGLPLGSTEMITPAAAMVNILGQRNGPVALSGLSRALAGMDAHPHIYGKEPTKVDRKMGHITVRAETADEALDLATKARGEISI